MATKTQSKRQEQLAKIAGVRAHVGPAAAKFNDRQILRLVELCGSVGLCADLLCMCPWPYWLERYADGGELFVRHKR